MLGVRTSVIGLIEGAAESVASLLKLYSGWLSDKLGTRKWLAVAGYSLSTLAKPFLVIASTWGAVLAVRISDRIGKGIRTAPRDALIADSIDEKQRGFAFGLHRAGDTAGALIGQLIAIGVVWLMQAGAAKLAASTFHRLVLISIIPAVLAVIVLVVGCARCSGEEWLRAAAHTGGAGRAVPPLSAGGHVVHAGQLGGCVHYSAGAGARPERDRHPGDAGDVQPDLCGVRNPGGQAVRSHWEAAADPRRVADLRGAVSGVCAGRSRVADLGTVWAVRAVLCGFRGIGESVRR